MTAVVFITHVIKLVQKAKLPFGIVRLLHAHCPISTDEINMALYSEVQRSLHMQEALLVSKLPSSPAAPSRFLVPGLVVDLCSPATLLGNIHLFLNVILAIWADVAAVLLLRKLGHIEMYDACEDDWLASSGVRRRRANQAFSWNLTDQLPFR